MKKETKTIIIGSSLTILSLILVIGIMYLCSNKKETYEERKPEIIEETGVLEFDSNYDVSHGTGATINDHVTLYLFHGSTCPHCKKAIAFLKTITKNYDNLEIKTYEVWNNKDNSRLMQKIAEALNKDITGVPFLLLGNSYTLSGYSERRNDEIKEAITKTSDDTKYEDLVQKVLSENPDLKVEAKDLKDL